MIQAIIFDCYGVLVRSGWVSFKERHFRRDPVLLAQAAELGRMADASLLAHGDFIREIAALAGVSTEAVRQEIERMPVNSELLEVIRDELKPHYKIGMLSNASTNLLDTLFEPWQAALFDEAVMSYQTGTTKPDPDAYRAVAERLGVAPEHCLFIDDHEQFCEAARRMGMNSEYYQDNLKLFKCLGNYNIFVKKT